VTEQEARMRLCVIVVSVICVLVPGSAFGQQAWRKYFGGSATDMGYAVQQTFDGGYIVAGMTNSFGAGGFDVYAVKTDSFGTGMWSRVWGGTGGDVAYSVVQTADSGYVIAGGTSSFGSGGADVWLIKTNAVGDTLWSKTYGGASSDVAYSIGRTAGGGYVIAGSTQSYGPGTPAHPNVWLVLTDGSGNPFWSKVYGRDSNDYASSVQQTLDGGFIIAGQTSSFGAGSDDVYLIKTNPDGDTVWTRTYGGADVDVGNSVQQTTDTGYVITGSTRSYGAGSSDMYLIKTNAAGDTLWTRTYGGTAGDAGLCVRQTTDGGYIVAGQTMSFGAGGADFYVVRTDAVGDTLWTRTFGAESIDVAMAVRQTSDGGYIVAGTADPPGTSGVYDIYLIKMAPDSVGGIQESPKPFASSPKLEPTIVSGVLNLGVDSRQNTEYRAELLDAAGRKVIQLHAGVNDVSRLAPGVYFVRAVSRELSAASCQKVVLTR
jgi:hypothetical protein